MNSKRYRASQASVEGEKRSDVPGERGTSIQAADEKGAAWVKTERQASREARVPKGARLQAVKLKEIAAEAGVSVMTVSNVLRGREGRFSEATRAKVQAVADRLDYTADLYARSLQSASTQMIALLAPDIYKQPGEIGRSVFDDVYVGYLVGRFEQRLRAEGFYVLLQSFQTAEEVFALQRGWRLAGTVQLIPSLDDELNLRLIRESSCPHILLDRFYPDCGAYAVTTEDEQGGYMATKACLEAGHRRIACVMTDQQSHLSSVLSARQDGYLRALAEAGLETEAKTLYYGSLLAWLKSLPAEQRPTALVCTSDYVARGLISHLLAVGFHVPEDISVTGYDNLEILCDLYPPLASVDQQIEQKVQSAVRLLLERQVGDQPKQQAGREARCGVCFVPRMSLGKPRDPS